MFYVTCEIHFSYGHRLLNHQGKCGHLHGHNGRIQVEVSSEKLDGQNMVMDFSKIREAVNAWVEENLDHKMVLWGQDPLTNLLKQAAEPVVVMDENPTAEAMARWIFQEARTLRLPVSKVTLWESEDSFAAYHE